MKRFSWRQALILPSAAIAFSAYAEPTVDFGPLQQAAQDYAMCAHTASTPLVRSDKSAETVTDAAMRSCAAKAEQMRVVTRKTLEPLAPSKTDLEAEVAQRFAEQQSQLRSKLIAAINRYRASR